MSELAILGGKPIRETYLPYGRQLIEEDDLKAVVESLKSDYLTTGPTISQFESLFAKKVGATYAVAVINGTAALHIACLAAGIGPGDEVITSPMTFAASANAVLYAGGTPVFCDIDPLTYNIDINAIEALINEKTKAIIPVHYTGLPCPMDELRELAQKYNLTIIEDGAHALGATYKGQLVGALSDMTTFSLHPVKHITTGEGGVITTNNPKLYEKLILLRTHGITRNPDLMVENHGPWYYEQLDLGYNYRITDFQCALGISQLNKCEDFQAVRDEIVAFYDESLSQIDGIVLQKRPEDSKSAHHLYVIQLDLTKIKVDRRAVYDALLKENIGVNVHYVPVYWHPFYRNIGFKKGLCPVAENLYERIISIPLFHGMTRADAQNVVDAIKKVVAYYHI